MPPSKPRRVVPGPSELDYFLCVDTHHGAYGTLAHDPQGPLLQNALRLTPFDQQFLRKFGIKFEG